MKKQLLARILCLTTVLLLVSNFAFSISFRIGSTILPIKLNTEKVRKKRELNSFLFNESEESVDCDNKNDEGKHLKCGLTLGIHPFESFALVADTQPKFLSYRPILSGSNLPLWLQTRHIRL